MSGNESRRAKRSAAAPVPSSPPPSKPLSPRPSSAPLTLLVTLSGGATLAAEVLGARLLRPLLGTTAVSQAGVVAGVLGSLGLGAWWTGRRLAEGRWTAGKTLVVSHLALAVYALVATPLSVLLATPMARVLVAVDLHAAPLATLLRAVLALGATVVPGALAGSLYPSAVRLFGQEAGAGTAWVGAASSIGASVAALLATFVLAPWLGVGTTLAVIGGVYALVAGISFKLSRTAAMPEVVAPSARTATLPWSTLAALALVGLASTAWQLALSRLGVLSFGPSAYALGAATAAHGMALGLGEAFAYRRLQQTPKGEARTSLASLCFLGALGAAALVTLALKLPGWTEAFLAGETPSLGGLWSAAFGAVVAMALPVAGVVGAVMAYGARSLAEDDGVVREEANGLVLLSTAAGNVVGGLVVPLVVLPWVRIEGVLALSALCLGVAAWRLAKPSTARTVVSAAVLLAMVSYGVVRARRDPGAILSGPFLYAGSRDLELGRVAWRSDGREATVAVRRDDVGGVLLQIDGKVDATSVGDATTQTVVGIVPTLMARDPSRVFVIGLGSGMTVDAARSVPGVRSVTVAELVPEVVDAARHDFATANHHCLDDARVTVRALDAAHYLRGTTEPFDVIVSEPSNPWVAGMSDLFTREAFVAARERLTPGGVMGVWFHAYSTDGETVGSIVETFRAVFPRSALVEVTAGTDYLLVGVRDPYRLDMEAFFTRAEGRDTAALLRAAGIDSRASLLARVLSGAQGVARVGEGGTVFTASSLVLEFRAPALLYRDATAEVFARFARIEDLPFAGLGADASPGSVWLRALDASEDLREAGTHARAMVLADRAGELGRAITEGDLAVSLRPNDLLLRTQLARLYLRRASLSYQRRDPGASEADLTAVLELRPHDAETFRALVLLGDLALRRRDGQRALSRYDEAVRMARGTGAVPVLHARRAQAMHLLGAHEAAAREMRAAGVR